MADNRGDEWWPGASDELRRLFSVDARLQRYLDVEATLALAQAAIGMIPGSAAEQIAATAHLEQLDRGRMAADAAVTGHPMMPLVSELSRAVGEPAGGWVHWGVTTQNIQQTGDVLGIRTAHGILAALLRGLLTDLAELGENTADTVMAGRTHWQQAVPITFGFKVAAWSDVLIRHLERLDELTPRLFTSMSGGAVGTFAALGEDGPALQAEVAHRLALTPMTVASRNIVDHFAELVCVLGLIAATAGSIAEEVARSTSAEIGELSEPTPAGDVGSTTMPQKHNPKLCANVVTISAQIRALVPTALEAMIQSHEVDGARSALMDHTVEQSCILTGDVLVPLRRIVTGLHVHSDRMVANLELTAGLINAEAVMMSLAEHIGRQDAHEVVLRAANAVGSAEPAPTFAEILISDPTVRQHLDPNEIRHLVDPAAHIGLSAQVARETSARARNAAHEK